MRAIAIPRLDPGAEGIHLAWSGPDLIEVSASGYDIQRRAGRDQRHKACVTLTREDLALLRLQLELQVAFGTVLYRTGTLTHPTLPDRKPPPQPPVNPGPNSACGSFLPTVQPATLPATDLNPGVSIVLPLPAIDVFTWELSKPTDSVQVLATAQMILCLAVSGGKVVAAASAKAAPLSVTLDGQNVDTVIVYTTGVISVTLCVDLVHPDRPEPGDSWESVPYIAKGITLPILEADPSLATPAAEEAEAVSRLVGADTLSHAEFLSLVPSLRTAMLHPELGRAADRILLLRANASDPFEELNFASELNLLQISPRLRRVLGFGYFDKGSGLVSGETYEYRITGHFLNEDLDDAIYDVHTVPTGTKLPAMFRIRDLSLLFAKPPEVVLDPPPPEELVAVGRRGISIDGGVADATWFLPFLDVWNVVITFPQPVFQIVLELSDSHDFKAQAIFDGVLSGGIVLVPAGPIVPLTFIGVGATELRLAGHGILFAVRIPAVGATGLVARSVETSAVAFAAQPLPEPPTAFQISNLQQPPAIITGDLGEQTNVPARPEPGFVLDWLPAIRGGVTDWPSDLDVAPPLDATVFQIEHHRTDPIAPFEPILGGENLIIGSRDDRAIDETLTYGSDLMVIYPIQKRRAAGAPLSIHYTDLLEAADPVGLVRAPAPLGSMHQYHIRAMDSAGRVSSSWTVSNIERLEKRIAPPVPVGPQPAPEITLTPELIPRLAAPLGPRARAIVAGDPTLTASDLALLGTHDSAILLEWGWRSNERDLDATAREFRIYRWSKPPDVVPGTITAVTSAIGGGFDLAFTTDRWLQPNECAGQWINSGGHPFEITAHSGGSTVSIHVKASSLTPPVAPEGGAALFGRPLEPHHQRPAFWDARVAVEPMTAVENYQHILFDALTLSLSQPLDTIWIGVSAADGEPYVPDEIPAAAPNGGRPGNESSIVICTVSARYRRRPVFSWPPPLGDIPELRTEEPTGRPVLVTLDLPALISGALPSLEPIALDRCDVDTLFRITRIDNGEIRMRLADGTTQPAVFPNPSDQSHVLSVLTGDHPERLESRYLLFLAVQHVAPSEIFIRTSGETARFASVQDRLAPKPARYFYRVRRADALGLVSVDGAILPTVVRVPSVAPAAQPEKVSLTAVTHGADLSVRVEGDTQIAHLILFQDVVSFTAAAVGQERFDLLRIPNRPDLYPADGLRLRTQDGRLLSPLAKNLADPDVTTDPSSGRRLAVVRLATTTPGWLTCWCAALTRDGIPSPLIGPFTVAVGGV